MNVEASWLETIRRSFDLVERSAGAASATIVTGEHDRDYWLERTRKTCRDVFRADGATEVAAIGEPRALGNFLGTVNAWRQMAPADSGSGPAVRVLSMVFGQGKRLSPFTQVLGNRKAAFPTPLRGRRTRRYLCAAELSNLYSGIWLEYLERHGFRGVLVKWGDEAILPSATFPERDLSRVDAVRFIWLTEPTPAFAREKDWVVVDRGSGLVRDFVVRQPIERLDPRIAAERAAGADFGVNLGSLAVSRVLMDELTAEFERDLADPTSQFDWDPYVWKALLAPGEQRFREALEADAALGSGSARKLLERSPDFFARLARVRDRVEAKNGRPLAIQSLDFGEALWIDMGLHASLARFFGDLVAESSRGDVIRALSGLADTPRDDRGNIVVDGRIAPGADVRDSVVLDATIGERSVVKGGVVIRGTHERLGMPAGGVSLFSQVGDASFADGSAIVLGAVADRLELVAGARNTTLSLPGGPVPLWYHEGTAERDSAFYERVLEGNSMSFEQAARTVAELVAAGKYRWELGD